MNSIGLLLILVLYLSILFFIAHWAEKRSHSKWTNNAYIYSFSLAVYCTAWTYYGSIGVAAESGLNYLPIYLGPIMIIPTWMIILKRMGVKRILTSGQKKSAIDGLPLLKKLKEIANGSPVIMPGGGINTESIKKIKEAGFTEIHFSATTFEKSPSGLTFSIVTF